MYSCLFLCNFFTYNISILIFSVDLFIVTNIVPETYIETEALNFKYLVKI